MIKVQNDRNGIAELLGIGYSALSQITEQGLIGIFAGTTGNLKNDRGFGFHAGTDDCLELFEVVKIESRDGISAFDCFRE